MYTKVRLVLSVLAALLLVAFYSTSTFAGKVKEPSVCIPVEKTYYLTINEHHSTEVPRVCAEGYHLASAMEMAGFSNMAYNSELGGPTDRTHLYGPPAHAAGWVHPGTPGDNGTCQNWTSTSDLEKGHAFNFRLKVVDATYKEPILQVYEPECSLILPVWCVSDPVY